MCVSPLKHVLGFCSPSPWKRGTNGTSAGSCLRGATGGTLGCGAAARPAGRTGTPACSPSKSANQMPWQNGWNTKQHAHVQVHMLPKLEFSKNSCDWMIWHPPKNTVTPNKQILQMWTNIWKRVCLNTRWNSKTNQHHLFHYHQHNQSKLLVLFNSLLGDLTKTFVN